MSLSQESSPLIGLYASRSRSNTSRWDTWGRLGYFIAWVVGSYFFLSVMTSVRRPRIATSQQTEFHSFPENFVWGSATSSYQVEGAANDDGRGLSIWDTFCQEPDTVLDGGNGDVACDHYHRIESDIKLMKDLGLKAYRFSIAWPRIIPGGIGEVNPAGVAFYNRLIDTLLEHGIEPWVTLFHWDLPQALEDDYQGWLGRETVHAFGEYARVCFASFGDRVTHWITMNESWTVSVNGYNNGVHAPGRNQNPSTEPYLAAHHLILAHARAARIYHEEFAPSQGGVIGISNCADFRYPQSDTPQDREAAERAMVFQLSWFADPIWKGEYPDMMRDRLGDRLPQFTDEERKDVEGSSDFFGLNHYSSLLASEPIAIPEYGGYWADIYVNFTAKDSWKQNGMGWSVVPEGCRKLLKWISDRYDNPIIYMTENGSAETEQDLKAALHDHDRINYFESYIRACAEAMETGVNLRGYFAWSFMDNFEWQFGYQRRFGLYQVNFDTLVRTPKLSTRWYRQTIEANGNNIMRKNVED